MPEPRATDPALTVLHALRCGGHAGLEAVSRTAGLPEPDVESLLIDLAVDGLVTRSPGPLGGWGLTDAGRAADTERIAAELDTAGARPAVAAAFERFLVLNPELLDLCTAWQTRGVAGDLRANEHDDPAYDARVLALFADLHARAEPVLGALAAALPRFGRYGVRLAQALARGRAGERAEVADSTTSYHAVWFQLHEDLLVTLGRSRHG